MANDDQRKLSGLGLASTILAGLSALAEFALIAGAGLVENLTGGVNADQVAVAILGLLIIAIALLALLGLILGLCGLFQKDRKRLFPIIGTALSALVVVLVAWMLTK